MQEKQCEGNFVAKFPNELYAIINFVLLGKIYIYGRNYTDAIFLTNFLNVETPF